jgi:hypothetical protein
MNGQLSELSRLLDQLDELIRNAKPVPLTSQVRVDEGYAKELVDRLRVAVAKLANGDH